MAAKVAAQDTELATLRAKNRYLQRMREEAEEALGSGGIEARSMAATVAAQDTELATLRAAAAKVTETQVAQRDVLESVQRTNRSLQRRQEMLQMRVVAAKVEAKNVTVAAFEVAVALRAELKESSMAAAAAETKAAAEVRGLMDERDSILAQLSALASSSAATLVQLQDVQEKHTALVQAAALEADKMGLKRDLARASYTAAEKDTALAEKDTALAAEKDTALAALQETNAAALVKLQEATAAAEMRAAEAERSKALVALQRANVVELVAMQEALKAPGLLAPTPLPASLTTPPAAPEPVPVELKTKPATCAAGNTPVDMSQKAASPQGGGCYPVPAIPEGSQGPVPATPEVVGALTAAAHTEEEASLYREEKDAAQKQPLLSLSPEAAFRDAEQKRVDAEREVTRVRAEVCGREIDGYWERRAEETFAKLCDSA